MGTRADRILEKKKLIVGSIIAVVIAVIPLVWNALTPSEKQPQFALSSPIFATKSAVVVFARNNDARISQDLHIEWDGLLFRSAAKMREERSVTYSWEFIPTRVIVDTNLLAEGQHTLRFGFDGTKLSDPLVALISGQGIVSIPSTVAPKINSIPSGTPSRRLALIIGNADYQQIPKLMAPVNDSKLLSDNFKEAGYEVTLGTDLSRMQMADMIQRFQGEIRPNDTVVVYFSGHGIELEGTNFILPVDANIADSRDVRAQAISIGDLTASTKPLNNQIVMYAAAPGTHAVDSVAGSRTSPFTSALAEYLTEDGIDVAHAFANVSRKVSDLTKGLQQPFLYSTASESVHLRASPKSGDPTPSSGVIILDIDGGSIGGLER